MPDERSGLQVMPPTAPGSMQEDVSTFLYDCRSRGLSWGTLDFYRGKLAHAADFMAARGVGSPVQMKPADVREYLVTLRESHSAGGVHAYYRSLRAFLNWWQGEEEPEGWQNPLRRVAAPKVPEKLIEPVEGDTVLRMLKTCNDKSYHGARDAALLLVLYDTGLRSRELLDLDIADFDPKLGQLSVQRGKSNRPRVAFLGPKTRRAVKKYLRKQDDPSGTDPLWSSRSGLRLSASGLREVLRRRARRAGVPVPSPHDFRRAFAIGCLRQGMDPFSLQRLLGHRDLSMVRRYLRQQTGDLRKAHEKHGPAEALLRSGNSGLPARRQRSDER